MINYLFNNEAIYIPVMPNSMHIQHEFSINGASVATNIVLSEINEFVKKSTKRNVIIDFNGISFVSDRGFKQFSEGLANKSVNMLFCDLADRPLSMIAQDCMGIIQIEKSKKLAYSNNGLQYYNDNFSFFESDIMKYISCLLRNYLKTTSIEKEQPLSSSNVWANKYIDVKSLFNNPNLFLVAILEMIKLMKLNNLYEIDGLLCASNNGAVISTCMGQLIQKPVIYLMNLGPHLTIRNTEIIDRILPSKKYVYIADMICMGTEYKMAKTLVKLKNSDLIGSISMAQYLYPDKKTKAVSIVDIQDGDDFNYIITVKKGKV